MRSQDFARGLLFCLSSALAATTATAQCLLPDLQAWSLTYNTPVNAGGRLGYSYQVSNANPSFPPSGSVVVKILLSADRILDAGDRVLLTETLSGSAITAAHSGTIAVASDVPAGTYYGVLAIDWFETVAECDESNNLAASNLADLVVLPADDRPDTAVQIPTSQVDLSDAATSAQAAIETGGDTDFYRLAVTAGAQYTLATELGTLTDTVLTVYDSSTGATLAHNDDVTDQNRASSTQFVGPSSGVVYAKVTAYSTSQTGTYRLVLTPPADDHPDRFGSTGTPDTLSASVESLSGSIERGGDHDWFRLQLTAGQSYVLETGLAGLSDTVLTLFGSDGTTQLAENDDTGSSRSSRLEFTATASVQYARVRAYSSSQTGAYTLRLASADDHPDTASATRDPADTLTQAAPSLSGMIGRGGDVDYFRIPVTAGTAYTVATELEGLSDTVLTLFGTDGTTQLFENDDAASGTLASRVTFTALVTGVFYARVKAYSATATGAYRLVLSLSAQDDHPDSIAGLQDPRDTLPDSGAGLAASLEHTGDLDHFRLSVVSGTSYRVALELDGLTAARIQVMTLSGTVLASSRDADAYAAPYADFTASEASGTVVAVQVSGLTDRTTGGYSVRFVRLGTAAGRDDHPETAGAVRDPEDALSSTQADNSGTIDSAADVDFFSLAVRPGRRYLLTLTLQGPTGANLAVLSADGTSVLTSSSSVVTSRSGGRTLAVGFTSTRVLALTARVRAGVDGQTGRYTLSLAAADDYPDLAADVTGEDAVDVIGLAVGGTLETASDVDVLGVALSSGRTYRIEVTPRAATRLRLELLDRSGLSLSIPKVALSLSAGAAAVLDTVNVNTSGTYYLRIASGTPSAPGAYVVRLLLPLPAVSLGQVREGSTLRLSLGVSGLPGELSGLLTFLLYDEDCLTPPEDSSSLSGQLKTFQGTPFEGLYLMVAVPEVGSRVGTQPGTTPIGQASFRLELPAEASIRGRISALITVIRCDQDLFFVLAPQADAGLGRVVEAFDAAGVLRPLIQDLPPLENSRNAFVRLDGRLSRDLNVSPCPLAYTWELVKGPAAAPLQDAASATPRLVPAAPGEYVYALIASNGQLESLRQETSVIVNRLGETPTAVPRAGRPGQTFSAGASGALTLAFTDEMIVGLDGSASFSPLTTRSAGLSCRWRQLDGPAVSLTPSTQATAPVFTAPSAGLYGFELTVSDLRGSVSPPTRLDVLLVPAGVVVPSLSLSASTPTSSGLGVAADTVNASGGVGSLRVTLPTTVWLGAETVDPEVPAGVHSLRYTYRQLSGPGVQLDPSYDEGPRLVSRSSFTPQTAGVHVFECRVEEVRAGKPTGVAVRRSIRVIADTSTNAVPTARAGLRLAGKRGGPAFAAPALEVQVQSGTAVTLDGRSSQDTGPDATSQLRYSWRQVDGPQIPLSDPYSPVTTFVTPEFPDSQSREVRYELYVEDGSTRSEPSPVRVQILPKDLPSAQLSLNGGVNLVGLPLAPRTLDRPYSVGDLLRAAGASVAAVPDPAVPGHFRVLLPDDPDSALEAIGGNQGYLLLRPQTAQPATTSVPLLGDLWDSTTLRRTFVQGFNLVHLPRGVPVVLNLQGLLQQAGANFAVVFEAAPGGRTAPRVYLPSLATPAPLLGSGKAMLLYRPGAGSVTFDLPQP